MKGATFVLAAALGAFTLGCKKQQSFAELEPGLERMMRQPRVDPFESSTFFAEGMAMRPPPPGTISREREIASPEVSLGIDKGVYAARMPIPVDRSLLQRGRECFEIFCSPCHGFAGDGESVVADFMELRRPPSLHERRLRAYPPGRLYQVVTVGYGVMPSYAVFLSNQDRWGVVAYVRALQLSRNVPAASLPREGRVELEKETP
jgi:mono/diheme cytochrome c family protein